ncbi:OB-fold-containig protein [Spartinivicinus ruber]|uniref:OB-fold-containig protein n=1 Tax=Spartinivicinus ruber TaxID=2683272 RepID=UPI0013D25F2B|nr:OB-fold-containig protein [Spartinivicinus ruber]
METFLNIIISFPTAIYTTLIGIVICYWLFALVGMMDIDILDGDIDIDADGDIEGIGGISGLMVTLGLTGVPITIVISLLALWGWLITYFASLFLLQLLPFEWLKWIIGVVIIAISFGLSIILTAHCIRPIKPFFKSNYEKITLVGRECTVSTSKVTEKFGQAICDLGSTELILNIRHKEPNTIKKGDKVTILEHNKDENTYLVGNLDINN